MANTSRAYTMNLAQFQDYCDRTARSLSSIDFSKPLKRSLPILKSYTQQNFDGGHGPDGVPWIALAHPRSRGGDKPLRSSGMLMASMTAHGPGGIEKVEGNELTFGTNLPYAKIHQEGGTIRPSRGRALSIPLTPEAERAGGARNFPGLFLFKRGGKPPLLAEKPPKSGKGSRSGLKFHYVLLPQVVIPARPFLGINAEMERDIEGMFSKYLTELAGGAAGGRP